MEGGERTGGDGWAAKGAGLGRDVGGSPCPPAQMASSMPGTFAGTEG